MSLASKIVVVLAIEDAAVGVGYALTRDWARAAYWLFAAGICAATLFMK